MGQFLKHCISPRSLFVIVVCISSHSATANNVQRWSRALVDSTRTAQSKRSPRLPRPKGTGDSVRHAKSLGTVVVTGARNEVLLQDSPIKIDLVDQGQITTTGSSNLGMILQEQAGIGTSNGLHSGAQIMGLSADYTQILVDGQPLIGRVAGVIDVNRIAVGNVKQLEIVKGPMSSLYGSEALAGVINIVTRRPSPGWSASLSSQFMQRQGIQSALNLGYSIDEFDLSLFTDMRSQPAFELHQDSLTVPYSGFKDVTIQARCKYYALPNLSFTSNLRYFSSSSVGSFAESYFGQLALNSGSVDQTDGGATLNLDWTRGDAHVVATFYASRFSEQYHFDVVQGSGSSLDDFRRGLIRPSLQYDLLVNEQNRLTVGTEYSYDELRGTRYPRDPFYKTFVGYTQWEGNPRSWINYALSARFDANNEYGENLSPKLSTLVRLSDEGGCRFSIGTGFKAPDFRQLYVAFRNNLQGAGYILQGARLLGLDLQAERSLSFDVSSYWSIRSFHVAGLNVSMTVEARLFYNSLHNMIEYYLHHLDGAMAVYSYKNVSRIRTQGVDCGVRMGTSLSSSDSLMLKIGYQYCDAADLNVLDAIKQGQAGTVDSKTGQFIALQYSNYGGLWYRSRHLANVRLDYRRPDGWSCNVRYDYVGRFGDQALDKNGTVLGNASTSVPDREDEYAPAYGNLKVAVSKDVVVNKSLLGIQSIMLTTGVQNLTNELNLRSVPTLLGRQLFLQVRCEW